MPKPHGGKLINRHVKKGLINTKDFSKF